MKDLEVGQVVQYEDQAYFVLIASCESCGKEVAIGPTKDSLKGAIIVNSNDLDEPCKFEGCNEPVDRYPEYEGICPEHHQMIEEMIEGNMPLVPTPAPAKRGRPAKK